MNDQRIEKETAEKSKTAPRVTPQHIEGIVFREHFFTTYDGIHAANMGVGDPWTTRKSTDLLTFCVLMLKNGFIVIGENACASPENFGAEVDQKIARQNAVNKIWMFEGCLPKQKLGEQQLLQKPFPTERL